MAPSGGFKGRPSNLYWRPRLMLGIIFMMCLPKIAESATDAKGQYAMDTREDCITSGFQDVPRDQTTYIQGRSESITNQQLSCYLQFMPKNEKDTLELRLDASAYIDDCDVTLELQMTGYQLNGFASNPVTFGPYTLGCRSNFRSVTTMQAVNGRAQIRLVRKHVDDTSYGFQIRVTARQSVDTEEPGGSSGGDTAMIAGIVAGAIVVIIIAIIICVCCYRKRRSGDKGANYKKNLADESVATIPSHGYVNNSMKNGTGDAVHGSPGSDRRLLSKGSFEEVETGNRPRTALERFGPPPSQRRRQNREEEKDNDSDRVYQEREVRKPARGPEDRDLERETQPPVSNEKPPRSPFLADLHENKRFRRSFHENEVDANDRLRRLSDNNGSIASSDDFNDQPRHKPKLPPVPKSPPRSPSPQRKGEKIAAIFRARPSSSSSEVARLDEDDLSLSDRPPRDDKRDTRHTLRPNRGERPSERKPREEKRRNRRDDDDDNSEEERRRRKRENDRRDDERQRRRRQEEEEEEREEREREKEAERRRKKREEEAELEDKKRKDRDGEYEGRFKKSASGRRSKGKAPRMGRSRSTGNALEEMDAKYQRSRSKSPSSVRSLNFIEDDDDDDLDSNYMPFRRAGSKTSLYASRSSLYGRKRKNSMGETMSMSSYAHDDVDSRMGDFDRIRMSHREKERMFRSTGDLEMRPASAVMVRDCATWTGNDKGVYIYGRRTLAKGRPAKRYNRGTQTHSGRQRRDSTGSARSGKSTRSTRSNQRLKSRSKSQESLGREKRSRSRDYSEEDSDSDRSRRRNHRSKSRDRVKDDSYSDSQSSKKKSKPRARPRKSTGTASVDLSDSDEDFDNKSAAASSVAPSSIYPPSQQAAYGPQFVPAGYPVSYQQPGVVYVPTAPGGPPMMIGAVAPGVQNAPPAKPQVAPKPNKSKWDQLVNLTEGMKQRRRQMGESITETGSVMESSMWSQPVHTNPKSQAVYAPPSYNTAQRLPEQNSSYSSAYPTSSGNQYPKRDYEFNNSYYAPSESNI